MSWFNRSPRRKEPLKPHVLPRNSSPIIDKIMEDAKKTGPKAKVNKKSKTG